MVAQKKALQIRHWDIWPIWPGSIVVCIASGPSLTQGQVDYCRGRAKIIVVNDNYRLAPWADLLYACDHQWWKWHKGANGFSGIRATQDESAAEEFDIQWIPSRKGSGLSTDPQYIHQGRNSGYQAINLAFLLGAKRIVLLGYDMHVRPSGRPRWFGHHPNLQVPNYTDYISHYESIAAQRLVEIINCTPSTALNCFPKTELHETL